jgi:hypothetical protein
MGSEKEQWHVLSMLHLCNGLHVDLHNLHVDLQSGHFGFANRSFWICKVVILDLHNGQVDFAE